MTYDDYLETRDVVDVAVHTKEPVEFQLGACTARLYCSSCFDLLPMETDCVIADPPYSAKTHSGHENGVMGDKQNTWARGNGKMDTRNQSNRKTITYSAWSELEIRALCNLLPLHGWACFLTSHDLCHQWEDALQARKRYVFAPLPLVTRGRSVRLSGDGPSSWTDWLIVSRTTAERRWGTLPGVYEGSAGSIVHIGGKALDAMIAIVEDYSREGNTVLDPCMGAGTTGIAALRAGRNFIGIELDPVTFRTACDRFAREVEQRAFTFNQ